MSHYFSEQADVEDKIQSFDYRFRGREFSFYTNSGMFSRGHLDEASLLLLESFDDEMKRYKEEDIERFLRLTKGKALDLGCGYGPLAIIAKRLYPDTTWTMLDRNERALAMAKKNLEENRIFATNLIKSDGFSAIEEERFSLILSNPPIRIGKEALYALFRGMAQHIEEDGIVYLVIGKKQGAASAKKFLATIFSCVSEVEKKKGFSVFACSHQPI